MNVDVPLLGFLLSDRNRAALLLELLDGRLLPASELASRVGVSRSLASAHLAKLERGGLVAVEPSGRHRYYRLARPELATLLEQLSVLAPPPRPRPSLRAQLGHEALRYARSCYDHLAGVLGVELTERMQSEGVLEQLDDRYELTGAGRARLAGLGVDLETLGSSGRAFGRRCVDWTERRHHLAGALGAALLSGYLDRGWLRRHPGSRALEVTPPGAAGFRAEWGIEVPPERIRGSGRGRVAARA